MSTKKKCSTGRKWFSQLGQQQRYTTRNGINSHGRYKVTVEYCLEWKASMNSKRLSKSKKTSKKACKTPSPCENAAQGRLRPRRQTEPTTDSVVISDEGTDLDLIDIINGEQDINPVVAEDVGKPLEELEDTTGPADEDAGSVSGQSFESTASGPCFPGFDSPMPQGPSLVLCSACMQLYQKAKKMKRPIKDKLLDNYPTSLTCDQWVLKKRWAPRKRHNVKGRLWTHLRLIKKNLGKKQSEPCIEEACSRPHSFLQRNLRRCTKVKRGKRARGNSRQLQRLAKQRRHSHSGQSLQNDELQTGVEQESSFQVSNEDGSLEQKKLDLAVEVIPCSVTMVARQPRRPVAVPKEPCKKSGFRDLLVQLRGNRSMIVKEPHL